MKTWAFRLHPGQDLRAEIDAFVANRNISAGCVVTCVGNLKKAIIRMADERVTKVFEGSFEIVSLSGTVEVGNSHVHIAISDAEGNVYGGHLKAGSIVGSTAEVVLAQLPELNFKRVYDPNTGFDELVVE